MKHTSFSIRFAPGPWCSLKQHIIPSNVLGNIQSGKSSPLTFCSARDAGKSLPIWCKFHTPWLQHYERVDILPNSTIKNSNGAKWALNVFYGRYRETPSLKTIHGMNKDISSITFTCFRPKIKYIIIDFDWLTSLMTMTHRQWQF